VKPATAGARWRGVTTTRAAPFTSAGRANTASGAKVRACSTTARAPRTPLEAPRASRRGRLGARRRGLAPRRVRRSGRRGRRRGRRRRPRAGALDRRPEPGWLLYPASRAARELPFCGREAPHDRSDLIEGHGVPEAAREPRPERDARRLGRVATFSGALFRLVVALVRGNDEGWGSTAIVSLFAGAAALLVAFLAIERRVHRADASARALKAARLHRRAARRLRGLGLDLRAVPLPDAVPPELPRPLALRGGTALPADHRGELLRGADRARSPSRVQAR
jgi:hypothetical protein